MNYLFIILIIAGIVGAMRLFKEPIRKWLMNLKYKLQMVSLRKAISQADKNKEDNGRKNMVVFNQQGGNFEPIEKKLLKALARKNKNKNNAAMTPGRKKFMQRRKKHYIDAEKVKSIEDKSLYVTN